MERLPVAIKKKLCDMQINSFAGQKACATIYLTDPADNFRLEGLPDLLGEVA